VPIWGKTLFKAPLPNQLSSPISSIGCSSNQQESANSRSVELTDQLQAVEQSISEFPTKRKVGRPKKIRQQENVGVQIEKDASSVFSVSSSLQNTKVCTKFDLSSFHLQSHFSSSKKHRESSEKRQLNSQSDNADTAGTANRKRGRPKKILVPEDKQPSADGLAFDFQSASTCNLRTQPDKTRLSSKMHLKQKKSSKNRDIIQVESSSQISLSQLHEPPKPMKRKVGRPKKVRIEEDCVVSAENLADRARGSSHLSHDHSTLIPTKIKSSSKHPGMTHSKKVHSSKQRFQVDLTSSTKPKHREHFHDKNATKNKRGPGNMLKTLLTFASNERLLGRPTNLVQNCSEATQSKYLPPMIRIVQSGSGGVKGCTMSTNVVDVCSESTRGSDSPFDASSYRRGDVFSAQELAHLPFISSGANAQMNGFVPDFKPMLNSPSVFSLLTPEKRQGPQSHCSSNLSRRSGFTSLMPSPSKLIFSPSKQIFSPSITSPPEHIGKL
jgi:hypothetical protein